ncbi:hypothetical protein [Aliarcobacter cibarius]|uniref:hypothetical protein n=1 Tax=Aliarcobacter cibarius TaxID=255507 RepID=UPI0012485EEA|nr:hypothetical protein [Aliarcobacter cibarius]
MQNPGLNKKFKNKDLIDIEENKEKQNEVIKKALHNYLFHNTKHLLFSSFAYALYKNSYDLIFDMLNINNSSKSEVIMIGHKVLPQNMDDIISMWIKENITIDDQNWKFKFGNVFSENKYYEAMLTFILILHLKITEDNYSLNFKKYSISELMFLKEKLNYLKEKIADFEIYKYKLMKQNNELDLENSQKQLLNLLNKLFSNIEAEINKKINSSEISKKCINELKDSFYHEYEESSDNIKKTLLMINKEVIKREKYIKENKKFGLKNKLPRSFFVEETNTYLGYLGRQYAESFIRGINTEIFKEILNKSENIFINELDGIIKEIGQNDVIIFSTNYSKILRNNKSFKHLWEIKDENYLITPSAYYRYENKNIPIFLFSTNFNDSKTFIINKQKFLTLIEFEPSLEKQYIKDNIYFYLQEIDADKENLILNLYTSFKIEFENDFKCFVIE